MFFGWVGGLVFYGRHLPLNWPEFVSKRRNLLLTNERIELGHKCREFTGIPNL